MVGSFHFITGRDVPYANSAWERTTTSVIFRKFTDRVRAEWGGECQSSRLASVTILLLPELVQQDDWTIGGQADAIAAG